MNEPLARVTMESGLVTFHCRGQQPLHLRPASPDALRAGQRIAERGLKQAKELVGGLGATSDAGAAALRALHDTGIDLAQLLAGHDHERVGQLQDRFIAAWPTWPEPLDAIPVIEVEIFEEAFPFELLPIFDLSKLPAVFNADIAGRRFLGLSTAVRRIVHSPSPLDRQLHLDENGKLPLQFVRHHMAGSSRRRRGLFERLTRRGNAQRESGSDRELVHLRELRVEVDGPWPRPRLNEIDVVQQLVDALYDPSIRLDGDRVRSVPIQVQHFACHCDTTADDELDYLLRISTEPGEERHVHLRDISRGYQHRRPSSGGYEERAVIVLNACRSSHLDTLSAISFPRWFLANGHRAFVGTQITVPDDLAAEWARRMYAELLGDQARPLGEANVLAARGLLEDAHTPLGLIYVVYGEPALSVRAEPLAIDARRGQDGKIREFPVPAVDSRPSRPTGS